MKKNIVDYFKGLLIKNLSIYFVTKDKNLYSKNFRKTL